MNMFEHEDGLLAIHENVALGKKLKLLHEAIRGSFPFVARIAVATYDAKTDLLKTFVHSSGKDEPLRHYQARLSETPSLVEMVENGRPRVVNDLSVFHAGGHEHTQRIGQQGYAASYTMPMYTHGQLFGFIFFNAYEKAPFTEQVLRQIDPYGHLIALTVINELMTVQTLLATVKTARDMAHLRDDETGAHQDRMSRYARLIAMKLADRYGFSDEYIENVFIFSPLHDIGKMGVPDQILLKPGRLTEEEFGTMKTHPILGRQLVDQLIGNFELGSMRHIDILRNIVELHHEAVDRSGYPHGLGGSDIPIEARITAVADVFDALTSRRPYKQAWSNAEAFAMLRRLQGVKLDAECVDALIGSEGEVEEIQRRFGENVVG